MKSAGMIFLSLYLILGDALAIEPVGTIGKGHLRQLTFLPDGNMLRVMSRHVEIVDPDSGAVLVNFASSSERFRRVIVSPDGKQLAIIRRDMLELWDIYGQKKLDAWEFESLRSSWTGGVLDYPFLIAFNRTQPLFAMNNGTDEIFLLDWKAGKWVGRLEDKRRPIRECYRRSGSSGSGSWSSSGCNDHPPHVFSIAFSPDDRFLAVGSKRPDAEIWDLETRKLIGHLEGHDGYVTKIVYSPDGGWIATTEVESTNVYLWNADTRQRVGTLRNGDMESRRAGEVFELLFSRDSRRLYVGTRTRYPGYTKTFNDRLRVWDVETGALTNEIRAEPTALKHVSVSPDESRAILQYYDQVVVLWDLKQNRQLDLWADYWSSAWDKLSPDGRSLVQVYNTLIKIWDVPSRSLRQIVFQGTQNYRQSLAISPDSRRFAVGLDLDGTEVRDIHSGELQTHLPDAAAWWGGLVFNNRGDRIATRAYRKNAIIVLDVDEPIRHELLGINHGFFIAFSADDRYLAAADQRAGIHLWEQGKAGYSYRYAWIPPMRTNYSYGANLVFHPHAIPPILVFATRDAVVGWQLGEQSPEQMFRIDGKGPVHFSADGRYLFLNGKDGLQIWNWRANQRLEHPILPEYWDVAQDGSVLLERRTYTSPQIWDVSGLILPQPVLLGQVKMTSLLPNFPNPFNPETWIPYRLSELAHVDIRIHDASGRQVRTLELGTKPAGDYRSRSQAAYWDGRNDAGEAVSSGLYFYTLEAGESRSTRRMNLVK